MVLFSSTCQWEVTEAGTAFLQGLFCDTLVTMMAAQC